MCSSANWPNGCRVSTLIISIWIGLLSPSSPSLSWTITYLLTYLLTYYLLTPWSRVLLEKLTGFQLVKKFPAFYGTRTFITAVTSAPPRHLSLSWASLILLRPYHSISPGPRLSVWIFRHNIRFYDEELLAPRPAPKLDAHPLSAVRDCLFNVFAAILQIGGRSSSRKLRTRHAVVTGIYHRQFSSINGHSPSLQASHSLQAGQTYLLSLQD